MARFLSPEWFQQLGLVERNGGPMYGDNGPAYLGAGAGAAFAAEPDAGDAPGVDDGAGVDDRAGVGDGAGAALVVEITVSGAPEGEVRYQVVVEGAGARVVPPGTEFRPAQIEMRSDYATMAGIASGRLSALDALSLGRARVSGDTAALSVQPSGIAGLDLVPARVRASTTF